MDISYDGKKEADRFIGQRIREERIKRGMTQSELAKRIGITYQQAHKYERGVNGTSVSRLLQIASILGIDITELLPNIDDARTPMPVARADLELARNFSRVRDPRRRLAISQLVRAMAAD